MCCDIHQKYPYLLVIGMFDGNVAVYNLQKSVAEPIYKSLGIYGKHSDVVWEVKWGPDMQDGEINFYSISSDGRVFNWVLMQSKLTITTIITLFLNREYVSGPDGTDIKLKGCGTCMIFHPKLPNIFLVGTEEGLIFKCSTEFSSRYLITYQAHYLPVYRIDFNKYNSNIFASCGADWRVKIWEDMRRWVPLSPVGPNRSNLSPVLFCLQRATIHIRFGCERRRRQMGSVLIDCLSRRNDWRQSFRFRYKCQQVQTDLRSTGCCAQECTTHANRIQSENSIHHCRRWQVSENEHIRWTDKFNVMLL